MRWLLLWAGFAVFAALLAYRLGDGYGDRMSQPAGYRLVAVEDAVRASPPRPRRAVIIVADGLRRDHALRMRAVARLAAAGQCHDTDVGHPSVSRPLYAVLSTGLEQDRTGVRNNDMERPIAAESIWAVAREAGLRVEARSELAWWRELFPGAFDAYEERARSAPYFTPQPSADVTLVHPVWIDEAGHDHGGSSPGYAAAVERLDAELAPFLDGVDLAQDLIVFTADHGHTDRGGHGGRTPEVSRVWSCFAGRGVARRRDAGAAMNAREIAPALAVLLGLRFPRHMRAGDDGLDVIWEIVDAAAFPPAYLDARHDAVRRFRAANPRWSEMYAEGRDAQGWRVAAIAALLVLLAGSVVLRRGHGARGAVAVAAWLIAMVAAQVVAHRLVLGGFDLSAINRRASWVRTASLQCAAVAALGFAALWLVTRDLRRALGDQALLVAAGVIVNLGLVWAFGAPLGFPLPTPRMYYLPYFAAAATMCSAGVLGIAALGALAWRLVARGN